MSERRDVSGLLRPTNCCFDDALDYLEALIKAGRQRDALGMVLAHGICRMPENATTPGKRFAHAWIEAGAQVIQAGIVEGRRVYYSMPWDFFCLLFQPESPENVTRYTIEQAWRENERTGTYGPWEKRYQELTRTRAGAI